LEKWERGNKIVLARYEDYNRRDDPPDNYAGGKKAYLDRIEFIDVPATETKLALLKTGEIDVLPTFPLDFYESFKGNADVILMPDFGYIPTMDFDNYKEVSGDLKVRQAILAAIDVDSVMNAVAPRELWIYCASRYVCGTEWESSAGSEGLYNQNNMPLAQQMLIDAGYAGETFVFWAPTELDILRQTGQVIGPMLEEIGFDLEWPSMDWATITARFNEGVWHAHNDYWGVGYRGTPMRDSVLAGNMDGEPFNEEPGPSLQLAFFKATTMQAKKDIVDDINRFFWDWIPSISFGQLQLYQAVLSDVKDVQVASGVNYTSAWLDR
jgi:peptide/nickel transport system substrate-binding protein